MSKLDKITGLFKGAKGSLFKNTIMLYILQFSSYLFSFITVPYQTRILGPVVYGRLGVAVAIMVYFQLFLDFGFLLSATAAVSRKRTDLDYASKLFTSVTIIKLFFSILSFIVMLGLCLFVPKFKQDFMLYMLYIISVIIYAFLPDYLYRGFEQMTAITVRTVLIKLFSTVMIFVFLKSDDDYLIVPILQIIGNAAAVIGVYVHMKHKLHVWFKKVDLKQIKTDLEESSVFFFSRIASTIYSTTNTIILGFIDKTGTVTGLYTSADKLVTTAKNGVSPISDSLYPYMIKNKDFKLVKKTLMICMPIITIGCTIAFIWAKPICALLFGEDFRDAGNILRALLPVVFIILPNYILGFPTLGAMGLSKYANTSIIAGTCIHIFNILLFAFTGHLNMISLAISSSISEVVIFSVRFAVVIKNRYLFKSDKN